MRYIESIEELERLTYRDERERPRNYKEHFYPCYVSYAEPWDFHFCGNWYFENFTPEETAKIHLKGLKRRRESLKEELIDIQDKITAISEKILALDGEIKNLEKDF